METKDVLLELRTKSGMSQEELAAKVFVTRQAVSRWETGETVPNVETLQLLSDLYGVSINTLLGAPQQRICQCCGVLMDDSLLGKNKEGSPNQEYCKWCCPDGEFVYHDMDHLIDVCVEFMANEQFDEEQVRAYLKGQLPKLKYWRSGKPTE